MLSSVMDPSSTGLLGSGPGSHRFSIFSSLGTDWSGVSHVQLALLSNVPFLSGEQIPPTPPSLTELVPFDPLWADLTVFRTGLFFSASGTSCQVGAELTSLRAVPEPASAALALAALAALACFRRGSRGSIAA